MSFVVAAVVDGAVILFFISFEAHSRFYSPHILSLSVRSLTIQSQCNCICTRAFVAKKCREKTLRHSFISTDRNDLIFCSCQRLHYNFWFNGKGCERTAFISLFRWHVCVCTPNFCQQSNFFSFIYDRAQTPIKCVELQINPGSHSSRTTTITSWIFIQFTLTSFYFLLLLISLGLLHFKCMN